jgi:DNA-binding protein HU-beta
MTKQELIDVLQKQAGENLTKKACAELVDELFAQIANVVKKEGRFSYPGFGTWSLRKRKARSGRNPQTGEAIKIKASKTIGFRPASIIKAKL